MTLRQKQSLFVKYLGMLIEYAYRRGYELTLADGSIDNPRFMRGSDGELRKMEDAHHMRGSLHYKRLAQDLNLFVKGKWITQGDHPAWKDLGEFWEKLDPICRWGGRFRDANHFSLTHEGKA